MLGIEGVRRRWAVGRTVEGKRRQVNPAYGIRLIPDHSVAGQAEACSNDQTIPSATTM
jgi:hypothetical protein